MTSTAVERAVTVAERAQQEWVDRAALSEPLSRDAHASAWVSWLFARAPARSGVEGPNAEELARDAGYSAETGHGAASHWRQDLRQVARLYDARKLEPQTGTEDRDGMRKAYKRALRLLPASALRKVVPVDDRIAQSIADAKHL